LDNILSLCFYSNVKKTLERVVYIHVNGDMQ